LSVSLPCSAGRAAPMIHRDRDKDRSRSGGAAPGTGRPPSGEGKGYRPMATAQTPDRSERIEPTEGFPAPAPAPRGMTEEAFEAWCRGREGLRGEWVDGEVTVPSPVSLEHADLTGFLGAVLRAFVEHHDLGRVLGPEFAVRFRAGGRLCRPVPDLLFV